MNTQKIFLILVGILFVSCHKTYTEEPTSKIEIPEGIAYQEIESSELQNMSKTIYKILSPDYTGSKHLFGKAVGCGPFLWKKLLANDVFSENVGIPYIMRVPMKEKTQEFYGRVIRWQDKTLQLESYLRNEFKNDGGFIVRRLNPEEMEIYWAMITYDISEPIFILESRSHKILLDFQKGKVGWVDDFKGVSFTD